MKAGLNKPHFQGGLYHDRDFYVSRLGDADGNNMFNCLLELSRKPINDYIIIIMIKNMEN